MSIMKIIRGNIFDYIDEYCVDPQNPVARYFEDGGIVVEDGKVKEVDFFKTLKEKYADAEVTDYSGCLIMPGFIDSHIHFPQTEIVASYGHQLMEWLNMYAFPVETTYAFEHHAKRMAKAFLNELYSNGTTTCVAFTTVHKAAANALFEAAAEHNMRIIAGKVAMNRNAHGALLEETDNSYNESKELIEQWHEKGRALYAITPRFAISCDEQLMLRLGELHREYPTTYIHTHLSENKGEMTVVDALFPECKDYLQVYEEMGMLTDRTIFAHGIHLSDSEMERIANAGASIAHCPTSNLFLGSGLFDMKRANKMGVQVSIATDIGAGTSFSQLQTLNEAYKVQQLQHYSMSPFESFYHITLGAAKALKLDHLIGSFAEGKEADLVVIDPVVTSLQRMRSEYMQRASLQDIESILFGVQMTGDDRNIRATYIMGECVYDQTIKQQ